MKKTIRMASAIACLAFALTACAHTNPPNVPSELPGVPSEPAGDAAAEFKLETKTENFRIGEVRFDPFLYYVEPAALPPDLAGKVFDKSGEPLTAYPEGSIIYDENGKEGLILLNDGNVETFFPAKFAPAAFGEEIFEAARLFYDDLYFPTYVPEGFVLTKVDDYREYTNGNGTGMAVEYHFERSDGEDSGFSIQLRYTLDRVSNGWLAADSVPAQFADINGHQAFFCADYFNITIGDVIYMITGKSFTLHDALNFAYSLTLVEEVLSEPKPFAIETTNEQVRWGEFMKINVTRQIVQPESLPPSLVGKFYDQLGNPLMLYPDGSVIYDENGNEGLICLAGEEVKTFFPKEFEPLEITDALREASQFFCEDMYYPAYLPEGYSLKYIDNFDYANREIAKEDMWYKLIGFEGPIIGNKLAEIGFNLRQMNKMTACETGVNNVQWVTIHGHEAFIREDGYVELRIGDIHYQISGKNLTQEDVLNMAYSLTLVETGMED